MRSLAKIAILALAAAAPAVARAADSITVPTSGEDSLPIADAGFDWNTFYAGVFGTTQVSSANGAQLGLGATLGVNARLEFVLVGAEVALEGLNGGAGTTVYGEATLKAGIAVADDLVLYGAAGLGTDLGTETDALVGGGVSLAVSDSVSLDARYLHGIPITGANPKDQVTFGANFHF